VISGQHKDALLQRACRSVQVGATDRVGRQSQYVPEEGQLASWRASGPLGHRSGAAPLLPLLVTTQLGHLARPVVRRPLGHGGADLVLAKRARAARIEPRAVGDRQRVEAVRLLHRLHDGAVRTRAIALHRQTPHLVAKGGRKGSEPVHREAVALTAVRKSS
jgi:hypothetical protein